MVGFLVTEVFDVIDVGVFLPVVVFVDAVVPVFDIGCFVVVVVVDRVDSGFVGDLDVGLDAPLVNVDFLVAVFPVPGRLVPATVEEVFDPATPLVVVVLVTVVLETLPDNLDVVLDTVVVFLTPAVVADLGFLPATVVLADIGFFGFDEDSDSLVSSFSTCLLSSIPATLLTSSDNVVVISMSSSFIFASVVSDAVISTSVISSE